MIECFPMLRDNGQALTEKTILIHIFNDMGQTVIGFQDVVSRLEDKFPNIVAQEGEFPAG